MLTNKDTVKYLPSWFPGCDWQRRAKAFKQRAKAMTDIPYAFVKQQHEQQKHIPSYVSRLLEQNNIKLGSEEELVVKWSAQSIYGGGAETVRCQFLIDYYLCMAADYIPSPSLYLHAFSRLWHYT